MSGTSLSGSEIMSASKVNLQAELNELVLKICYMKLRNIFIKKKYTHINQYYKNDISLK